MSYALFGFIEDLGKKICIDFDILLLFLYFIYFKFLYHKMQSEIFRDL